MGTRHVSPCSCALSRLVTLLEYNVEARLAEGKGDPSGSGSKTFSIDI